MSDSSLDAKCKYPKLRFDDLLLIKKIAIAMNKNERNAISILMVDNNNNGNRIKYL